MDISIEKAAIDCSLGSLFQQIINDMKNSSPLWEDFIIKATKLHACLRAAIQAISTYLEAFQKIADAATNSKGASKEIGTALTRVCLRHKAVETRMKTFTTAIMDSLIIPLQDKLEEWKRQVVILDKDHTKEYKRCRNELKKRSSDTLRLQKKAKKGTTDLQSLVDSSMQTVNQQKAELDEVERKSLRTAMIEDRTRYCQFVNMLQPVVKQEYEMMYELGHLQEAMQTVTNVTKDPTALPQPAEELIAESKTSYNLYPDSPTHSSSQGCSNSLGSRKSSVCSISSMNSSGSSGSPGHQFQRSLSQYNPTIRLKPGESSDSGFCSSPALTSQISAVTSQSHAVSTWPPPGTQEAVTSADRPHTISTAYERGHQRPALTVYTFQNPETISESTSQKSPAASLSCRPPLPIRCSSLERPLSATSNSRNSNASNTSARQCPSPIPAHVAKEALAENGIMDSIDTAELDNLIGELDLFQKEHEAKERQRMEQQQHRAHHLNGHSDYQIPLNNTNHISSLPNSQNHHNDSLISASTTLTGIISHAYSNSSDPSSDKNDKISLSASLNYSLTSNMSMINCSGSEMSKYWNDNNNDSSADTGFENPSFVHLNDTNIVLMRDEFPDNYFQQTPAEIVVLRCKDTTKLNGSNNNSITDLNMIEPPTLLEQKQRLSSFKSDNNNSSIIANGGSPASSHYFTVNNAINNNPSIPVIGKNVHLNPFASSMYGQMDETSCNNNVNVNVVSSKPAITPRPASLLSGVSRIARRSSVNTVKPPPPVRRSSSVTPSNHGDANNSLSSLQHQSFNVSSESLPPPPAYLLDRNHHPQQHFSSQQQQHYPTNANSHYMTSSNSMGQMTSSNLTQNVSGAVKTLTEMRHTPASPGLTRKQLSLSNHHSSSNHSQQTHNITYSSQPSTPKLEKEGNSSMFSIYGTTTGNGNYSSNDIFGTMPRQTKSQQGVYAQPKQVATVSSFRTSSPNPPPKSTGLLASLTARITPNKSQNQQQQQQSESNYQRRGSNQYYDGQTIYGQQQSSPAMQQQIDGKNPIYSQSPHHQTYQQQHQYNVYNQNIYVSTNPFISPPSNNYSPSSFGKELTSNYSNSANFGSESSVLSKTAPGFLDNLNAKLAEQRANNKAYAVRSYINSKVVPDPRIVRESLMDQIKRGATLKTTRSVNDR